MFVFSNFISAIASILNIALTLYMWIIIVRAVISWVNPDPYNAIVQILYKSTEPVLYRVRRLIPFNFGGFDFSPIVVIFAIIFIQRFLIDSLMELAAQLR
jgi:YggT family protein